MKYALALILLATPLVAQDQPLPLSCEGPDWSLNITQDGATFDYITTSDLDLMLDTPAKDADYPRALTLIGRGDSAIVILENQTCDGGDLTARILTQRGETPVLLTGCCETYR